MNANPIKAEIHQIDKTNTKWREQIEQFTNEITTGSKNRQGTKELTQIELFGQNLLYILVSFDGKALF
jgi:hypothetical protein